MDKYKRLYDSAGEMIKKLEAENAELKTKLIILEAEKTQWLQQKMLQDQVIAQRLGDNDNVVRALQDEICALREKLKNGSND